ncbi:MAG: hypothetical protein FJW39_31470 [Acidobacteria bacterium]|nr:hypothetical protein [Acidobacteriota bacterium]
MRDQLDHLLSRYRQSCPEPEAGAGFTPGVWARIEARRNWIWKLQVYARGLVGAAAAACMMLAAIELSPWTEVNPLYTKSYLEALDDDDAPETLTYVDVIHHLDGGTEIQ